MQTKPDSPLLLEDLEAERLDMHFKGLPQSVLGTPLRDIGAAGIDVLDGACLFPVAVLKQSALEHNSRWMHGFLALTGTHIAPHGKTTMAPQLFARQLEDGAWGITAATVSQMRIYRRHGVQRILFANQLTGKAEIDYVLDELERDPRLDFYCLVDSVAGLQRLQARLALRTPSRPLQVLLEVGVENGRTGVRNVQEGIALGRAIRDAAPAVVLRGIETFEGVFGGYDHVRLENAVRAMLDMVVQLARSGLVENWFGPQQVILTAGGSAFFDLAAQCLSQSGLRERATVVLRSGCYLTHDSCHYERYAERMRARMPLLRELGPGLRPALEIVAQVQSLPEPGLAIAGFGKRDASFDIDLPKPIWWYRPGLHAAPQALDSELAVKALNDQHAFLSSPGTPPLEVGDLLGFGISHPCTTFDKWPLLLVVDDGYRVVSAVRTYF